MGSIRRKKHGPEWQIQQDLIAFLQARSWHVERMIGNAFQMGIPDLFIAHIKWGTRWIDVKAPGRYSFTKAQKIKWPIWSEFNIGIWILTGATEAQYDRLFAKPNWKDYWKPSWGNIPTLADIDLLMADIRLDEDEDE